MEIIDYLLARKKAGGGSDVTIEQLSVTENGTYSEQGKAYSPVVVNVPTPANSYQLKDVPSGTVSTIDDGTALPMPSLKVGIEPVQSGSGDPSPDNIRPISGWDEANVMRTGKNLIDIPDTAVTSSGTYLFNGDISLPAGSYMFSILKNDGVTSSGNISIAVIMSDGSAATVSTSTSVNRLIRSINASKSIISMRVYAQTGTYSEAQLELGSTVTTYEPYNGQTYTIQFRDGDNPLTVYGGTLDVTTGELVVDRWYRQFNGTENWYSISSDGRFYLDSIIPPQGRDGNALDGISSIAKYYNLDGISDNEFTAHIFKESYGWIGFKIANITEVTAFKALLSEFAEDGTPASVCIKLDVSTTYHLTPTQVRTLVGTNSIWADTGDVIEGKYFKSLV